MWLSSRHRVSYSTPCVAQLQTQSVLLHPLCGSAPDTECPTPPPVWLSSRHRVSYSTPCVAQLQTQSVLLHPLCGSAPDTECPTPPPVWLSSSQSVLFHPCVAQLQTECPTPPLCGSAPVRVSYSTPVWLSSRQRVSYSTPVWLSSSQSILLHRLCGSAPDRERPIPPPMWLSSIQVLTQGLVRNLYTSASGKSITSSC